MKNFFFTRIYVCRFLLCISQIDCKIKQLSQLAQLLCSSRALRLDCNYENIRSKTFFFPSNDVQRTAIMTLDDDTFISLRRIDVNDVNSLTLFVLPMAKWRIECAKERANGPDSRMKWNDVGKRDGDKVNEPERERCRLRCVNVWRAKKRDEARQRFPQDTLFVGVDNSKRNN